MKRNEPIWMNIQAAAAKLGEPRQALAVRACYYRRNGRPHVVRKVRGVVEIDVANFRHERWASPEQINRVKDLYYQLTEHFDSDSILAASIAKITGGRTDTIRCRLKAFTFKQKRVCDEMESAMLELLTNMAVSDIIRE